MPGFESMCALTSEAIMLTGDTVVVTSWTTLGLDGRRPLRPFKLSVLTTRETQQLPSGQLFPPRSANQFILICTKLTFPHHAYCQTLLEAAELAPIPPPLVHRTVLAGKANILGIFLYRTL